MLRTIFTFFCFFLFFSSSYAQQSRQLVFREETYDFGAIDEHKGPVTHEFIFINASPRPVKVLKVQASCGCTTPGWSQEVIPPGKEGFVKASYDPKGRPGFFTKSLTVTTDLEANPVILQIKGQVTDEAKGGAAAFPIADGALKMKVSSFNMGRIYLKDEYVVREFPVMNGGDEPLTFTGKFTMPDYIKVDVQPRTLAPGETAAIKVSYNGALKNKYGFQADNVEIETDDKSNPVKSFAVYATLEDFFPKMTATELADAPQLSIDSNLLDFGSILGTAAAEKTVLVTNTGKKELIIKSVQPNCACVETSLSKHSLKPGETAKLNITFDPSGRRGTQNKAVTIYSNDPRNSVQRLTFTAYIQ